MTDYDLTNGLLQKRLQIANCCAAKKGLAVIKKQKKGLDCSAELNHITQILDTVDALKSYINVVNSKQALLTYDASAWTGGAPAFNLQATFNFIINGSNFKFVIGQSSIDGALTAMANLLNSQGLGVIASYDSVTNVFQMLAPTAGTIGNSYVIFWTASGAPMNVPNIFPQSLGFFGGVDGNENDLFDDTGACLTTNEIKIMLNKLCELCADPCETYVNFAN
jgi:hypothetical protein